MFLEGFTTLNLNLNLLLFTLSSFLRSVACELVKVRVEDPSRDWDVDPSIDWDGRYAPPGDVFVDSPAK